jgi:2-oxoglutarate dehydrogenase E2 component (dihydrolipoamide succinyltransferase)
MPNVVMPQLGETVGEGTVTKWLKAVGDAVTSGEPLFEVSTDKVDSEIPAPFSGILTSVVVPEGSTVDVGVVLAVIGGADDGNDTSSPASSEDASSSPASASPASSSPASTSPGSSSDDSHQRSQLSPVVRKLLEQYQLDPAEIVGTGNLGRITRSDVESAAAQKKANGTANERSIVDTTIPFSKIRQLTAERMVRSKATSAHTLMAKEVDYERVEQVRRTHGARFKEELGFSLTYLSFNAAAVVQALREFPYLNSSVGDDALIVHHDVNLGIAVDVEDGLIVPVLHRAQELSLRSMAQGIRDLADRTRSKSLDHDDIAGGTFSITNPGPFGTYMTGAVINQPQVAILSTDGVSRKPVVHTSPEGTESIAIHSVGVLALTFDHRAVDGAYVARFLARVSEILNSRDWVSELL